MKREEKIKFYSCIDDRRFPIIVVLVSVLFFVFGLSRGPPIGLAYIERLETGENFPLLNSTPSHNRISR